MLLSLLLEQQQKTPRAQMSFCFCLFLFLFYFFLLTFSYHPLSYSPYLSLCAFKYSIKDLKNTLSFVRSYAKEGLLDGQLTGIELLLKIVYTLHKENDILSGKANDPDASYPIRRKILDLNLWLVTSLVLDFLTLPPTQLSRNSVSGPSSALHASFLRGVDDVTGRTSLTSSSTAGLVANTRFEDFTSLAPVVGGGGRGSPESSMRLRSNSEDLGTSLPDYSRSRTTRNSFDESTGGPGTVTGAGDNARDCTLRTFISPNKNIVFSTKKRVKSSSNLLGQPPAISAGISSVETAAAAEALLLANQMPSIEYMSASQVSSMRSPSIQSPLGASSGSALQRRHQKPSPRNSLTTTAGPIIGDSVVGIGSSGTDEYSHQEMYMLKMWKLVDALLELLGPLERSTTAYQAFDRMERLRHGMKLGVRLGMNTMAVMHETVNSLVVNPTTVGAAASGGGRTASVSKDTRTPFGKVIDATLWIILRVLLGMFLKSAGAGGGEAAAAAAEAVKSTATRRGSRGRSSPRELPPMKEELISAGIDALNRLIPLLEWVRISSPEYFETEIIFMAAKVAEGLCNSPLDYNSRWSQEAFRFLEFSLSSQQANILKRRKIREGASQQQQQQPSNSAFMSLRPSSMFGRSSTTTTTAAAAAVAEGPPSIGSGRFSGLSKSSSWISGPPQLTVGTPPPPQPQPVGEVLHARSSEDFFASAGSRDSATSFIVPVAAKSSPLARQQQQPELPQPQLPQPQPVRKIGSAEQLGGVSLDSMDEADMADVQLMLDDGFNRTTGSIGSLSNQDPAAASSSSGANAKAATPKSSARSSPLNVSAFGARADMVLAAINKALGLVTPASGGGGGEPPLLPISENDDIATGYDTCSNNGREDQASTTTAEGAGADAATDTACTIIVSGNQSTIIPAPVLSASSPAPEPAEAAASTGAPHGGAQHATTPRGSSFAPVSSTTSTSTTATVATTSATTAPQLTWSEWIQVTDPVLKNAQCIEDEMISSKLTDMGLHKDTEECARTVYGLRQGENAFATGLTFRIEELEGRVQASEVRRYRDSVRIEELRRRKHKRAWATLYEGLANERGPWGAGVCQSAEVRN